LCAFQSDKQPVRARGPIAAGIAPARSSFSRSSQSVDVSTPRAPPRRPSESPREAVGAETWPNPSRRRLKRRRSPSSNQRGGHRRISKAKRRPVRAGKLWRDAPSRGAAAAARRRKMILGEGGTESRHRRGREAPKSRDAAAAATPRAGKVGRREGRLDRRRDESQVEQAARAAAERRDVGRGAEGVGGRTQRRARGDAAETQWSDAVRANRRARAQDRGFGRACRGPRRAGGRDQEDYRPAESAAAAAAGLS